MSVGKAKTQHIVSWRPPTDGKLVNITPIRVVIVDDHEVVRRGLSIFLSTFDDLSLVGEAKNGAEAITLCSQLMPDVVLMDLVMPEMDGITSTRIITQRFANVHVIAFTSHKDDDLINKMMQVGAVGSVPKNASIDELATAIRAAYGKTETPL